ncbi:MAG: UDP-3-O-(3-hydroxymyristoyl)glucosamine N-acyltransferase [Opitutales bacterium]|nr:UDP-3-O-(3-hydroxymyristoyl)glucosamine N-acyltransferase [Opitutales bacterium]
MWNLQDFFMLSISYSLKDICDITSPKKIIGHTSCQITGICDLAHARTGDLAFLGNMKYHEQLRATQASVVLVSEKITDSPCDGQCFLVYDNPSYAFGLICRDVEAKNSKKHPCVVHPSAVISKSAKIGKNVSIGPNVVIEDDVEIGNDVVIFAGCYVGHNVKIGMHSELRPGVKIMNGCIIGQHVLIHPGVVIGSDGFGYETVGGVHEKIPQIGNVVIEDDVEIGANTTIDRARFSSTVIGRGTKIDNLVQIGHNVHIGKCCLIVSQVGIAGSTTLEDYVVIGGQSGIAGHITIGARTMAGGQSGIQASCPAGSFLRGSPAMPYYEATKYLACRKYLPELVKKMKQFDKKL